MSSLIHRLFTALRRLWPVWLLGILLLGVAVRIKPLMSESAFGDVAFRGAPLVTCYDGYLYLRLARDLATGNYQKIDEKRSPFPRISRKSSPPVLSVLAERLTSMLGLSLRWVAAILPVVFSVSLGIPLFVLGRRTGGVAAGLVAAAVSLLAPYYVYRSSLGWFDTDCLNVVFPYCIACALLYFGENRKWSRYVWLALAVLFYLLFLQWWEPRLADVVFLSLLVLCLVLFYRATGRELVGFLAFLVIAGAVAWPQKWNAARLGTFLQEVDLFLHKGTLGQGPAVLANVTEMVPPGLEKMIAATSANVVTFVAGIAGLAAMLVRHTRIALFLAPLIALGLMGCWVFKFMLFLVPPIALGIAYWAGMAWRLRMTRMVLGWCCTAGLVLLVAIPLVSANARMTVQPKVAPDVAAGMERMQHLTETNAVVWCWWDTGYTLQYWADRRTILDGGTFSKEWGTFMLARPFAMTNSQAAANWIRFYTVHDTRGMKKLRALTDSDQSAVLMLGELMTAGPSGVRQVLERYTTNDWSQQAALSDCTQMLFPASPPPIYLFLDRGLARKANSWYRFGTWDFNRRAGLTPHYHVMYDCRATSGGIVSSGEPVLDGEGGFARIMDSFVPVNALVQYHKGARRVRVFPNRSDYHFEYAPSARMGIVTDAAMAGTVFHRLYARCESSREFELVCEATPSYQIWRVSPEPYAAPVSPVELPGGP